MADLIKNLSMLKTQWEKTAADKGKRVSPTYITTKNMTILMAQRPESVITC